GDRPAVAAGVLGAWVPGRVSEGGFGGGVARLPGIAVRDQAQGGADLVPGVPGFAGVADVVAGVLAGGEFDLAADVSSGERDEVGHHRAAAVGRAGDELVASGVFGEAVEGAAGQGEGDVPLPVWVGLAGHWRCPSWLLLRPGAGLEFGLGGAGGIWGGEGEPGGLAAGPGGDATAGGERGDDGW